MKTIVFDLDDTLANLKDPMVDCLNSLTGKNLQSSDLFKFDTTDIYGITNQDFFNCLINNDILDNLEPFIETRTLLTDLLKNDYNITIITSRAYHPDAFEVTKNWFAKYEIPYSRIIISEHGKKKSDYVTKEENVILFIDDRIENCEDFIASRKAYNVRLFDAPWNQQSSIARVANLSEVRQLLNM